MDIPTFSQFGFIGAATAAITMLWGQVKTVFTWVSGLVLERATYMDSAGSIVTRHLEKHGKPPAATG